MSVPPQTIRVKRKRVEEAPVTFLQFDQGAKRVRSGSNWVYRRRDGTLETQPPNATRRDAQPIIHVSKPDHEAAQPPGRSGAKPAPSPRKTLSPRPSLQKLGGSERPEPRRFHLSRTMMAAAQGNQSPAGGVSKKAKPGAALFVERSRNRVTSKVLQNALAVGQLPSDVGGKSEPARKLKKPSTTRAKSPNPNPPAARAPLPASSARPHEEDMDKIAADMNQWVLNEIGANLQQMETDRKAQQDRLKYRPKAPAKRYQERHPDQAQNTPVDQGKDTPMTDDVSEDDGNDSDWVIDEYVRIPAASMAVDVSPGDVGVLVLDGEGDDTLFFGPENDEEDNYLEDDEDENGITFSHHKPRNQPPFLLLPHRSKADQENRPTAEDHYTADYPEDEVDSDDEYGRHAYYFRNRNASDEEEFDNDLYSDSSDEMIMEGDDDDVAMARIKAYVRRRDAAYR
ncbi:hypothetical protein ACRE_010970 [Hapsidospora chrysogenum ATCC 11550]|uniref:Transcription factor Iwr1 domain-containing protein n=1 Tax=Hapsidospora chrysogenum (strain ATCC 11550 / CBS 779.69 / DSM 880 / IAM 14645 / JCM 23072 / IMI 49137) TaxID=857340 RepID=A0A086TFA5_HAPC1|nr:hypothetical protein ACRE_010970 [Hapsidospora chrysogenum ATCC 11550]